MLPARLGLSVCGQPSSDLQEPAGVKVWMGAALRM
jgi:hypothetical protein